MRMSNRIGLSLAFSIALWGAAFAEQGATAIPRAPDVTTSTAAVARIEVDCQKLGGEVSALIDREKTSANISAARAVFQRGIMDCMEGDQDAANSLYREAKRLLNADESKTPVPPPRP